jgi:hypothetical protein
MAEYKTGAATVRIHGAVDQERLKAATAKFMKKAIQAKRKKELSK